MRLFAVSSNPLHATRPYYSALLCAISVASGCGGKRFESLTDAGTTASVSDESKSLEPGSVTTASQDSTTSAAATQPQATTSEQSPCDGGDTCLDATDTLTPADGGLAMGEPDPGTSATPSSTDAATSNEQASTTSECTNSRCDLTTSSEETLTSDNPTTSLSSSSDETTSAPIDECPDVLNETVRGSCGCGMEPEQRCETLANHLAHRYTFDGEGTQLTDLVGQAHGTIHNCELAGAGQLELDGDNCYVELPSGMISKFSDVTLEVWLRWDGGESNQRIFNFGTREDDGDAPSSFISLSPRSGDDDVLTLSYLADPDDSSDTLRGDDELEWGDVEHLAVVVDSTQGRLELYVWAELVASMDTYQTLTALEDQTLWLGRALYSEYPYFHGALVEFRVYDTVLSADELAKSAELGLGASHL